MSVRNINKINRIRKPLIRSLMMSVSERKLLTGLLASAMAFSVACAKVDGGFEPKKVTDEERVDLVLSKMTNNSYDPNSPLNRELAARFVGATVTLGILDKSAKNDSDRAKFAVFADVLLSGTDVTDPEGVRAEGSIRYDNETTRLKNVSGTLDKYAVDGVCLNADCNWVFLLLSESTQENGKKDPTVRKMGMIYKKLDETTSLEMKGILSKDSILATRPLAVKYMKPFWVPSSLQGNFKNENPISFEKALMKVGALDGEAEEKLMGHSLKTVPGPVEQEAKNQVKDESDSQATAELSADKNEKIQSEEGKEKTQAPAVKTDSELSGEAKTEVESSGDDRADDEGQAADKTEKQEKAKMESSKQNTSLGTNPSSQGQTEIETDDESILPVLKGERSLIDFVNGLKLNSDVK